MSRSGAPRAIDAARAPSAGRAACTLLMVAAIGAGCACAQRSGAMALPPAAATSANSGPAPAAPATPARAGAAPSAAATPANAGAAPALSVEQRAANVASFDRVWTTIRDSHWDPTLGGLDWEAARTELRPRIEQASTMAQARALLGDLIGRLKQSHFAILPADAVADLQVPGVEPDLHAPPTGDGTPGLELRVVQGRALVTAVVAGSGAERLGVRPGWEVVTLRGKDVAAFIERVRTAPGADPATEFLLVRALQTRLQGPEGGTVPVTLRNGEGKELVQELSLGPPRGALVVFGNLPPTWVWVDTRRLPTPGGRPGTIGYIAFNAFLDPARVMEQFGNAVRSFAPTDGVILDLRGNPGGIGAMAMGIAGWFIGEKDRYLGTMITRETKLRFVVLPRSPVYTGPLAVLVDGLSASTAEILAAGLQDLGRARVFGQRTAGMALPSYLVELPNGDGLQYAFASYVTARGTTLEGRGVIPDEPVELSAERLLQEGDPILRAAERWIEQSSPEAGSPAPRAGGAH